MTREQQYAIDKLVGSRDEESRREVAEKIFPTFEYLIYKTIDAVGVSKDTADYEDIVQNARVSLYRALMEYSPDKGSHFATYAITAIRNSITNSLVSVSWSKSGQRKQWNLSNLSRKFAMEYGRTPNREELSELLGVPVEEFDNYIKASRSSKPTGCINEDIVESIDIMDSTTPIASIILKIVSNLDDDSKFCMLKHLDGYTYREIAEELCISSSRVGQLIITAREKIAEALAEQGYNYD